MYTVGLTSLVNHLFIQYIQPYCCRCTRIFYSKNCKFSFLPLLNYLPDDCLVEVIPYKILESYIMTNKH